MNIPLKALFILTQMDKFTLFPPMFNFFSRKEAYKNVKYNSYMSTCISKLTLLYLGMPIADLECF